MENEYSGNPIDYTKVVPKIFPPRFVVKYGETIDKVILEILLDIRDLLANKDL